jgi:hypothetical protein
VATNFNANFVPTAFGALAGTPAVDDIYVFTNFTQGNVLADVPFPAGFTNSNSAYTPLWQVNLVTWNAGKTQVPLTSQSAIQGAVASGNVTVTKSNIIVECSVIYTRFGGLLPGAKVSSTNNRIN